MQRMNTLLLMLAVVSAFPASARSETAEPAPAQVTASIAKHLTLGGFVRTDFIFDSRQSQVAAEGLYTYYPLPEQLDAFGKDINAAPSANILALTSRLTAAYTGPEISGARTRAYVEADFGSNLNGNGAVFRMRQAYMELQWDHASLLLGQTWHPMSAAVVPVTLDLNTGSPFRPFNRSPQIRFSYGLDAFRFTAAAVYQHSYASTGPDGVSSKYLRNAVWPDWTAGVEWQAADHLLWGVMGETKALRPQLYTTIDDYTIQTDETVRSWSGQTWVQYASGAFQLKAAAIYAQNMYDAQMMGGYALAEPAGIRYIRGGEVIETKKQSAVYTPTQHLNCWLMLQYGGQMQVGLYAGYLQSLGTLDVVNTSVYYGRACDMDHMIRVAPRVSYTAGNLQLAGEVEWNRAVSGELVQGTKGDIARCSTVDEVKLDLAVTFLF